jgi:hypothetical protein
VCLCDSSPKPPGEKHVFTFCEKRKKNFFSSSSSSTRKFETGGHFDEIKFFLPMKVDE